MIKKVLSIIRTKSISYLFTVVINHIYPRKAESYYLLKELLIHKTGLEIGGPSNLFSRRGLVPVYPLVKQLDNCNFSSTTIWEGQITDGYTFRYDKNHSPGKQYILEASKLSSIPSAHYDFLLSSHVIEHIANPIKALYEWNRVLKDDGTFIIIIPHKDGTFDNKRNITPLYHIIEDYKNNIEEDDLTHLDEILKLHDLKKDPEAGSIDQFKIRSYKNFENRSLHHHVFSTLSAVKLIDFVGLKILSVEAVLPYHIIIIAAKSENCTNDDIIKRIQNLEFSSPFKSDKDTLK